MKDLPLSLLSRGCGRLVSSNRNTGRHDGRVDVCFTPQDYYIWKSKETLLRLSNSGHLFAEAESALPKTYSTRRGALLLYSQDLVSVGTNHGQDSGIRKKKVIRRDTRQVRQRLGTLKELTAAILSYSKNQYISSRLAPSLFPPLQLVPAPKIQSPSPVSIHTTQPKPRPELLVQLNPQWHQLEKNTEMENQPEDTKEEQENKKRVRLDVFLQIPRASRPPTPQMNPQPWVHYVTVTTEEPEELQTYEDSSLQHPESLQHTETKHHTTAKGISHSYVNGVRNVVNDRESIQHGRSAGGIDVCATSMSGNIYGRIETDLHPQKVGHSVCHGPCWEKKDRPKREDPSTDSLRLPPITESYTIHQGQGIHAQSRQDDQPQTYRARFQTQENLNRLHQQPLYLPLLFPEQKEETSVRQKGREKAQRQNFKKDTEKVERGERPPSEKGPMILLEPGKELPPPVGVLGCVAGWKSPGKQSSLAFLQNREPNLHDPSESSYANRGVVRGVLPLELRDFRNGKSVGCLILGPDGEIIQLSVHDNSQDSLQGGGDLQQQALQVLSTGGEELPWVIVLQPEHANTEGREQLNTCVPDTQRHQSINNRGIESHMPVGKSATEDLSFSTEQLISNQLLDHHRSTDTKLDTSSGNTDTVVVTRKKTQSQEALLQTRTEPEKVAKSSVKIPPLIKRVGKDGLRGDSEERQEENDEELSNTEQNECLYGSHQPGEKLKSISPTEETTKDSVGKQKKKKNSKKTAITTGKTDVQTVKSAESQGQGRRMRKEEKWQSQNSRSDVQSIRSQKPEGRSSREAAETQDLSVPPSVGREGGRDVEMNVETEDQEEESARQKKVSDGRRKRRGRLKHKELVAETPQCSLEKEINQVMQGQPHHESSRSPSSTRTHSNNSTTEEDLDSEYLSTSDRHSSIQSVSSPRSTVTSTQFNPRSSLRSMTSSCEGTVPASAVGLTLSRGRLSSCSTVMITEDQLMLNPVKPEFFRPSKRQEDEKAAAQRLAQRAERRRQEVERKKREREEEDRKRQEREQTEERMKNELEEERRKRAEELRLKKLSEEDEARRREDEEQERARWEQAQRERESRRQEERRRQMERLHRIREEEEQRRRAELERLRLEEEKKQEEESKKLEAMDESERIEYLRRKKQEDEDRRNKEEERKRREEEAALWAAEEARLQAELLTREMTMLQQQWAFKRGLLLEAGGLEKTQGISRPWIYSYFALQPLGLTPSKAETTTP